MFRVQPKLLLNPEAIFCPKFKKLYRFYELCFDSAVTVKLNNRLRHRCLKSAQAILLSAYLNISLCHAMCLKGITTAVVLMWVFHYPRRMNEMSVAFTHSVLGCDNAGHFEWL